MAEELTTFMHEEFLGDEIDHNDIMVMAVFGAKRRIGLDKALEEYGITKEFYEANIKRVLSQP